jgi:hypothetical protein
VRQSPSYKELLWAHAGAATLSRLKEERTVYLVVSFLVAFWMSRCNGAELNRVKLFPFSEMKKGPYKKYGPVAFWRA